MSLSQQTNMSGLQIFILKVHHEWRYVSFEHCLSVLQWRHQLDIFSNALQTGQLDVRAFGLEFQVRRYTNHGVADGNT